MPPAWWRWASSLHQNLTEGQSPEAGGWFPGWRFPAGAATAGGRFAETYFPDSLKDPKNGTP